MVPAIVRPDVMSDRLSLASRPVGHLELFFSVLSMAATFRTVEFRRETNSCGSRRLAGLLAKSSGRLTTQSTAVLCSTTPSNIPSVKSHES